MVERTTVGEAAATLLPEMPVLRALHACLARPGASTTLDRECPSAGAVLRWLLAADPLVDLIVQSLSSLGDAAIAMPTLVQRALQRDRSLALAAFFNPGLVAEVTDGQDEVVWQRVEPRHFRSSTFFQYKSLLKHAGIIKPQPLGGSSTRSYNAEADLWELMVQTGSMGGMPLLLS